MKKNKFIFFYNFFNYIGNIPDSNKIIIYGTGNIGCWISTVINNWKGYFVDDDINKQNTIFLNKKVLKPSFGKKILIPFDRNRVKEILKKNNIKATKNIFYYGKI